ncbi:MFS transporter [Sphingomonas nostoxanthinifaciens]|uniref:MFS transporter n=1 Tax=Sphingomonas nostoxanthinifaciens TaxID=2872652 RepID=UPI001CC1DE0A|nr:MFS transporter [Sphingomonas nostoxanthinifaciens]UAK24786.1 MFS transporter [Sphingomonas nostoxanthinifaciens]
MRSSDIAATRGSGFALAAGIILIGANLRAPITSLGPVLPDIRASLRLSGAAAGLLNALPLLLFAILSLVAPRLGRRHGLERILGASIAAILAGTMLRSLWLPGGLWIGTVLLSAGIAFGNVLLPGLVKRDFPDNATGMIGLYAAAMAGMAGLSAGLAVPIARLPFADWRWSLGAWGALSLLTLLVWLPQMRASQHQLSPTSAISAMSPWRHPVGWQVSLFFALHSLIFYSIVDWFASYVADAGVSPGAAGMYLLVYQVVAVATNLGSASLIRRFRDQRLLGFSCGMCLLIATVGLLVRPDLSLLWLIVGGMGAGIAMVTSLSLFALRTRDHHQAGALSGMAQFIGYAGAAAGPLLVGVLHDATGGWSASLSLLIVASALVIVFAALAGRNREI